MSMEEGNETSFLMSTKDSNNEILIQGISQSKLKNK